MNNKMMGVSGALPHKPHESCDEIDSLRSRLKEKDTELVRTKGELSLANQICKSTVPQEAYDAIYEGMVKAESLLAKAVEALHKIQCIDCGPDKPSASGLLVLAINIANDAIALIAGGKI